MAHNKRAQRKLDRWYDLCWFKLVHVIILERWYSAVAHVWVMDIWLALLAASVMQLGGRPRGRNTTPRGTARPLILYMLAGMTIVVSTIVW